MHLKSIVLKGFKSFADKVKIDFEPDITCIVGPNGSGKSNISDAIRWVLGEQSAKSLRGNMMKDVIFAGSSQRKGVGMAEVSLTLDNSGGEMDIDYNEVKITRRVTANGESDYLINNNLCRLKDIKELIMDTGLGKRSYAIISQGKVKAVLNGKTNDRRELFEEAAGISKHKQRKEKSLRRLEKNEQKLQRVKDIISEIKRQVGPLEKEAKKAKEFKVHKKDLCNKEINLMANEFIDLDKKFDDKVAKKQNLSYKITNFKAELNEYEFKLDKLDDKLAKQNKKLEEKNSQIYKAKENIKENENKIELVKERKKNLIKEEDYLKQEIEKLEQNIIQFKQVIKDKQTKIDSLNLKTKDFKEILKEKNEELELLEKELANKLEEKNNIQQNKFEKLNNLNDYKHQLAAIKKESKEKEALQEELLDKKNDLEKEVRNLKSELESKQKALVKNNDKLDRSKNNRQSLIEEKEQQESKLKSLQKEITNFKDDLNKKTSRIEFLQDLAESYKGYYRGVRNLMKKVKERGKNDRVFGVVAELINTKKDYETAIEVALGSVLQNVVVKDETAAKKAINYLKKNKSGRATFLPLSIIKPRSLNKREKKALELPGVVGVAQNLVDYDKQFAPVIKNILGRILVTKDMDSALEASKQVNQRLKIVTIKGEIINPGGAITGGSRSNNNNLLGRSREIESLQEKIKKSSQMLEEKENLSSDFKANIIKLEENIKDIDNQIQKQELKKKTYQIEIKQSQNRLLELEKDIAKIEKNLEEKKTKQEELRINQEKLSSKLSDLDGGDDVFDNQLHNLKKEIEELEDKKEKVNNNITDLKVKIGSIGQEIESLHNESDNREKEIRKFNDEIGDKKKNINRLHQKREEIINKGQSFKEKRKKLQQKIDDLKIKTDKLVEEKSKTTEKIKKLKKKDSSSREEFEKIRSKYNKLEVSLGQLEVKLENIEKDLKEKYDLDIDEIINDVQDLEETEYSSIREEIKSLKRKINKLKPVNLGAIEEFKTLQERFGFLKEQHGDLLKAKESLQDVIKKIDKEMAEKFLTTFNKIKVEFEQIFSDLFEGGEAKLKLENPDDLLETGIEINAQPPGKNLKKLSLMSGGEKALTATALIFALLKVMPSPFYVLDELDAPLDDANVNRFCNYLNKLSSISQFIVITHRKRTMRAANALYGVAMQESGVSKLLSLKLDNVSATKSI